MINQLPRLDQPEWLTRISQETINEPFPLKDVLRNSLYYPAADIDGDPVAYLAGNVFSFVYVDYGVGRDDLLEELRGRGFLGYQIIAHREISMEEFSPTGWMPIPTDRSEGLPRHFKAKTSEPFCEWLVFERFNDRSDEHGPHRFSLLYICADGVAAFEALYLSNGLSPTIVAIIQPGHGFGGNWTDFTDPEGPLARAVLNNAAGKPEIILNGGAGGRDLYKWPCWPQYPTLLGILGNTSIHLWKQEKKKG